jgi:glycosyltransferase involved in cell wall biosynthesis
MYMVTRLSMASKVGSDNDVSDLVSIIIPAYNAAPYIKETIESVFSQTYRRFEVIVVNDGSTDTAVLEEILLPYREAITYIKQENRGISSTRNTGLRAATGHFISFLDSDDIWMPNYLEQQVSFLLNNPERQLVYCNAEFFGANIPPGEFYMDACPSDGEADTAAIISKRCTVFTSITAHKDALLAIGFDESLRLCEDLDCWLRFTAAGYRIGYQKKVLVRYRRHPDSLSANTEQMTESNIVVMKNTLRLFSPRSIESDLILKAIEKRSAELDILRGKKALKNREFDAAKTYFRQANLYYRNNKNRLLLWALETAPVLVVAFFQLRSRMSRRHRMNNG